MKRFFVCFTIAVSSWTAALAVLAAREMPRHVSTGSNQLRMSARGTEAPTVILDCFGPGNLELWNRVQPEVAKFARVVAYDHGGYWGSTPGPKPRDARQIVEEVRAGLRQAGVMPPYIIAGYSFGGPYARVFAGMYPMEVAGLVLIDPTQEEFMEWLKQRFPEFVRVSDRHKEAQDEVASQWDSLRQAKEAKLPEVPLTLITGMKPHDPLTRYLLPRWRETHAAWLSQFPQARHIVTTNTGHDVVLNEPLLVIDTIREVVEQARRRPDRTR
jgi:pimeloyl-ACP methyl ester carboxylesterase